jgi:hypothetical protein
LNDYKQFLISIVYIFLKVCFGVVVKALRKVPGSIPGGVTGDFFRGIRQFHVPGVDSASKNKYQDILDSNSVITCGWQPTTFKCRCHIIP